MSSDDKKQPDDVKSRRELLTATAKLSAFIAAIGLTGTGLSGSAAADAAIGHSVVAKKTASPALKRGLPVRRTQEVKLLLNDALRTGDSSAALARHRNMKLSPAQQAALKRITPQEWAALRSAQSKLRAFDDLAAGDTGVIFW